MSMAPFSAPPISPQSEARRMRLAALIALLGIAATLLAYAVSPGVRHAVSHAAHSVKGAVTRVLDHDKARKRSPAPSARSHTSSTHTSTHSKAPAATSPSR